MLKVSQAVSGEIVLEKVVETLLRTAIEHAGAQRGALILPRGSELLIHADAKTNGSSVTVRLRETPVSMHELPESIVRYAARTQETVILDDASARNPFSTDEYIRKQHPRSVLCLPLIKQGALVAVLYLENNLGPNFFAPGRIAVLKVLASQAAISLDNSRLYRDLAQREQALRQIEAYLAEAQRLTHTGSWAFDRSARKAVYWSDEMFRIYGRDPHREGLPSYDELLRYVHPDDRDGFSRATERGRDKPEMTLDYRIVMADGMVKHVHSARLPVLDKAGGLVETVGTLVDVTERKRAEQRLLVQYRVTRILAEAATVEEATPKILQAVCECLGWDLGALWRVDRVAGALRCAELWRTSSLEAAQFEAITRTSTFSRGSGLPGRVWASGAPAYIPDVVRDPNFPRADIAARERLQGGFAFPILLGREVLGVIEFFSRDVWQRDDDLLVMMATIGSQIGQFTKRAAAVDELRNTQAELAHTTRVLTMGELTASIAHEVNQPLGAIVASAGACERWLAATPPQMEKARRALERIANDGRRAGEVIKRIRALMKRQAPQKEWLQINEAILEVIAIAQHQLHRNDILLETQLAEGLPLVLGDRVQLQQVLLNLIVNGIEAMSGIDTRRRELTIVSAADGPEAVAVEVRDTGMGVDAERAAHLFEPFYTTKSEGLGIGLSISRTIVEAHGGHLSATKNVPHGAVFRFSVPLEEHGVGSPLP